MNIKKLNVHYCPSSCRGLNPENISAQAIKHDRTAPKYRFLALNKYSQCPKTKHSKMNQTFSPN